eukprot:CAMPEP_0198285806 /NCGR_PEP_ID=MMETSP1449-20131203/5052_1 /TAXON_ID=420275 /ORGANISM="Attheya septentrionalis, Strain CCMP2084" /LENGTH=348 /DNA_ID=CAMNT_0043983381 /DNA_START=114 /DNA_END=1157 /DNA_ORIENTATION=+
MRNLLRETSYADNEKYDKIRRQQLRRNRFLAAAVLVFCSLVGIMGLLLMIRGEAEAEASSLMVPAAREQEQHDLVQQQKQKKQQQKQHMRKPKPVIRSVKSKKTEGEWEAEVEKLDAEVRRIKAAVPIFQVDKEGLAAAEKLQEATRRLMEVRYGPTTDTKPYRVKVVLEFQKSIPDFEENGPSGSFLIEMAPVKYVPHSVFTFLEVARNWKSGAFHRVAGHVLQVLCRGTGVQHLAFQEYHPKVPHKRGTVGYAGRPSGPEWYVSIQDNSKNHGPGSQQNANPYEADAGFGTVIEGFEDVVVKRIRLMPGHEFINDKTKHVNILQLIILVPSDAPSAVDGYIPWTEW